VTGFRASIPPEVAEVIRHLPPDLKRSIKAAIRAIAENPLLGDILVKELDGFSKYRVKRFRIVYAVHGKQREVRLFAVGHRRTIYEEAVAQRRGKGGIKGTKGT
jgi:mRNA interferase RelE/StbE